MPTNVPLEGATGSRVRLRTVVGGGLLRRGRGDLIEHHLPTLAAHRDEVAMPVPYPLIGFCHTILPVCGSRQ